MEYRPIPFITLLIWCDKINTLKTLLAKRLTEVRKFVGLSHNIFPVKIGINIQGLSNYEHGDRFPDATFYRHMGKNLQLT